MKNKTLIITTIIFFLLVNTSYYWESKLGFLSIPAFLLLVVLFLILLIVLVQQLFLATQEKFGNKQRLLSITILIIVLGSAYFKPMGLVNFQKFEGKDILIAQREGVANCMTTFKLKEHNKFKETSVCFGITETKGDYKLKGDTIFFENVELGRSEKEFYQFALIRPSRLRKDSTYFDLVRYKDLNDTTGEELWIIKNDLYKPEDKEPNR